MNKLLAAKKETKPSLPAFITSYELQPDMPWSNKPFKGILQTENLVSKIRCTSVAEAEFLHRCSDVIQYQNKTQIEESHLIENKCSKRIPNFSKWNTD